MANAATNIAPPPPLRASCTTLTCNEHCAHCRENDRIAAELVATGFWTQLAADMYRGSPLAPESPKKGSNGAAAGAGGAEAAGDDADYQRLSPPCYLHEVALHPTATACVAVYNGDHMDSCGQCKYYHIKRLNSPGVKYHTRGKEVFVASWE